MATPAEIAEAEGVINPILRHTDGVTLVGSFKCEKGMAGVDNMVDAAGVWPFINQADTVVILSGEAAPTAPARVGFSIGNMEYDNNYMIMFKGAGNINGVNVTRILLLQGDAPKTALFHYDLFISQPRLVYPTVEYTSIVRGARPMHHGMELRVATYHVYNIGVGCLKTFLEDTSIDLSSKVITWLYWTFPFSRKNILETWPMRPYNPAGAEALLPDEYIAASAILILGPFYSRIQTIAAQLEKRLNAATATAGFPVPPVTVISRVITSIGITNSIGSSVIDQAMGVVVCRTKQNSYDPMIITSDLESTVNLFRATPADVFGPALYNQLRLVAIGHRQKSLGFSKLVFGAAQTKIRSMGTGWALEADNMRAAITATDNRPYTGLQNPLPVILQIASWAKCAAVGLAYHELGLTDPAQKSAFDLFETTGVTSHIATASDKALCRSIANQLASPSVISYANFLRTLTDDEGAFYMGSLSADTQNKVFNQLVESGDLGIWGTAEAERRKNMALKTMASSVVGPLTNLLSRKVAHLVRQGAPATYTNPNGWNNAVYDWEAQVRDEIDKLAPGAQGITVASVPGYSQELTDMNTRVNAIIAALNNVNIT